MADHHSMSLAMAPGMTSVDDHVVTYHQQQYQHQGMLLGNSTSGMMTMGNSLAQHQRAHSQHQLYHQSYATMPHHPVLQRQPNVTDHTGGTFFNYNQQHMMNNVAVGTEMGSNFHGMVNNQVNSRYGPISGYATIDVRRKTLPGRTAGL
jgi:hypothetical protein